MKSQLSVILLLTLFTFAGVNALADAPAGGAQIDGVQNEADEDNSFDIDEDADEEDPFELNEDDSVLPQDDSSEVEKAKEPRLFNRASKEVIEKANQIFENPNYRQALLDAQRLIEENPGTFFPAKTESDICRNDVTITQWSPIEWALSTGRNRRLTDDEVKIYRQVMDEAANAAYDEANKTSDPQLRLAKLDDVRRQYPGSSVAPAIALELGDALAKQSAALIAFDYWTSSIRPEITERKQSNHWEYTYPSEKCRVSEAELAARLLIGSIRTKGAFPSCLKKISDKETDLEAFRRLFPTAKAVVNSKNIVIDDPSFPFPESMTRYDGKEVVLADYLTELKTEIDKARESSKPSSFEDDPENDPSVEENPEDYLLCNQYGLYDARPVEINGVMYSGKYLYYHKYESKEQDCIKRLPFTVQSSTGLTAFLQGVRFQESCDLETSEDDDAPYTSAESVLYSGRVPQDFEPASNSLICIDRNNGNKVLWTRAWNNNHSIWKNSGYFFHDKLFALEVSLNPNYNSGFKAMYLHCLDSRTGKTVYTVKVANSFSASELGYKNNTLDLVVDYILLPASIQHDNFSTVIDIDFKPYTTFCQARILDGKIMCYYTSSTDKLDDDDNIDDSDDNNIPGGVF